MGRTSRDAPANAAVTPSDPVMGPGRYKPGVPISRLQREWGDFDASTPGGFGRGPRISGYASAHDEVEASGPFPAQTGELAAKKKPEARLTPGGKIHPPPRNGRARTRGPLDASSATSPDVAPGTYNAPEAFRHAVVARAPHASVLGRPPVRRDLETLGPTTYDPFAPLGFAGGHRETTPAGAGGLHYSFSASSFFGRSPSKPALHAEAGGAAPADAAAADSDRTDADAAAPAP